MEDHTPMYRHNSILRARLLRDGEPGATPGTGPAGGGPATAQQTPTATTPPANGDDKSGDEPLGEGGVKALKAERERGDRLEKELKTLAPLRDLAAALGGGNVTKGKTEIEQLTDRLTTHEQELTTERQARWRAELAHEHGLTPSQAKRLIGTSREEMAADAAELVADFQVAATGQNGSGKPKPDRSQGGGQGASPKGGKDAGAAEAARRFGKKTTSNT